MSGSIIFEIQALDLLLGSGTIRWLDISQWVKEAEWSLGAETPYQIMGNENTARITLKNEIESDGQKSAWSPETAIAAYRELMKTDNRLRIQGQTTQGTKLLWQGRVHAWEYEYHKGDAFQFPTPTIIGYSNALRLKERTVNYPATEGELSGTVIGTVCVLAGVASGVLDRDDGTQVIPYSADQTMSAWDIITEATKAEYGKSWIGRNDHLVHRDRYFVARQGTLISGTANAGQADDDAGLIGEAIYSENLDYKHGDTFRNMFRVHLEPRATSGGTITLWELDNPLSIAPGGTVSFEARLRKEDGEFVSSTTESFNTTGIVWTAGTGTVNATVYGGRAVIDVTATSPGSATLGSLTLEGVAIQRLNKIVYERDDREAGDLQWLWEETIPVEEIDKGKQIVDWEAGRRNVRQTLIHGLPFRNGFAGSEADFQMRWTMGTAIRVAMLAIAHDRHYMIIGERHFTDNYALDSVFYLEPVGVQYYNEATQSKSTEYRYGVYNQTNYDRAVYVL